jgi:hypothetical protein
MGPTGADSPPGDVRQRWFDNDGRLIASGGRGNDRCGNARWWMHWGGLSIFWFGDAGNVTAEPVTSDLAPQVRDAFARGVTPVVLLARGFEALHASGVLHPRGVIGFCGTSGTGKSTLALALSTRGLPHFADDTIVYEPAGPDRPLALALPSSVRVDSTARFAAGPRRASSQQVPRAGWAPIHRIYHLVRDVTIEPRTPQLSPIDPARRFERLLAHAHPFEMGSDDRRRAFFKNLLAFAGHVEVWECRFAPALEALPSLAARIQEHALDP